jgi:ankyrin repeat protein
MAHSGEVDKIRDWLAQRPEDLNIDIGDGYTLLHVACLFGHEPLVRFLLERGALVNVNAMNESRAMPLHGAVSFRDEETAARIAKLLISHGAELNGPQRGGQTALHHAVGRGSQSLTQFLISEGADPHIKDDQGRTPGDVAREFGGSQAQALANELKRAHSLPL